MRRRERKILLICRKQTCIFAEKKKFSRSKMYTPSKGLKKYKYHQKLTNVVNYQNISNNCTKCLNIVI
jgi:hypothetical protein